MIATESKLTDWSSEADLFRCTACQGKLGGSNDDTSLTCQSCRQDYPIDGGILVAKAQVSDNNKVAVDFYNSPLWPKFRFWEWFTFACNGGERRSRDKVLRHLPKQANLKLLDVAIGDGVYLDWLPKDWEIVGIDVSTVQLEACQKRSGDRKLKLILGEAEALPVQDDRFDAALSIGGFNYFNDPKKPFRRWPEPSSRAGRSWCPTRSPT